jgi:hypothetical protein
MTKLARSSTYTAFRVTAPTSWGHFPLAGDSEEGK